MKKKVLSEIRKNNCTLVFFLFVCSMLFSINSNETLHFTIDYLGLTVANVSFIKTDSLLSVKAKSTALTNFFTGYFDNTYKTTIDSFFLPTIYQKSIEQRKYTERSITIYDFYQNIAFFVDTHNDILQQYSIQDETRDFFSALFFCRTLDLEQEYTLKVDAAGKIWLVNITYLKVENLKTSIGEFHTKKIQVTFSPFDETLKMRSDIFTNNFVNSENTLYIWFTDDLNQIPVKTQYSMKRFNVFWNIKEYKVYE